MAVNSIMKNKYYIITISLACIGIVLASFRSSPPDDKVAYPEGYRDWTHVKTYIIGPKNPAFKTIGGFNHVYANDVALKGYRTGDFPDGSIIVQDNIATAEDSISVREGSRAAVIVMIKDAKRFAASEGWGFEAFRGDSQTERLLTPAAVTTCVNCHKKNKQMVFSELRK
jgi:hypothetical protein